MNEKDFVMMGIIGGIAFFFIGAIILNVFPSSELDLLSFRVSAVIKLLGLGVLTTSMVVGGLTIKDIDANQRTLLLLLGLVLLIIYSVASPALEWRIPGWADQGAVAYDYRPTAAGIPGFEIPLMLLSLVVIIILGRRKFKRQ